MQCKFTLLFQLIKDSANLHLPFVLMKAVFFIHTCAGYSTYVYKYTVQIISGPLKSQTGALTVKYSS